MQSAADPEHLLEWNDSLQDWLDGDAEAADAAAFEAHLAGCTLCQAQVAAYREIDIALAAAAPRAALDASFDAKILEQIDAIDERQRLAIRQRVEQELQRDLRALTRNWRRTLAFVIPGVIAGIALAFTLSSWISGSDLGHTLIAESAGQLGYSSSQWLPMALTTILGAGLGLTVARWLASAAE